LKDGDGRCRGLVAHGRPLASRAVLCSPFPIFSHSGMGVVLSALARLSS
jgi:hypothetical protein